MGLDIKRIVEESSSEGLKVKEMVGDITESPSSAQDFLRRISATILAKTEVAPHKEPQQKRKFRDLEDRALT